MRSTTARLASVAPWRGCGGAHRTSRAGAAAAPARGSSTSTRPAYGCRPTTSSGSRSLVIPPAWRDVWICPWPNGHLQAVGTDDAGRRQYLYHPDWRTRRDAAKFARVLEFGRVLSQGPRAGAGRPRDRGDEPGRACAVAVRLLDLGYFRIGNDVYAEENGSFGLTTLQRRHVRKHGATLVFAFVGKSGIEHEHRASTTPPRVEALEVMRRRRGPADERAAGVEGRAPLARPRLRPRQRLRPSDDGHRGDREGLPHLARDRARGRRAGRDRRAGRHQGLAQAGRGRRR